MSVQGFKFGTAINCIDGRTHLPVLDYMKKRYSLDGVDLLTFAGADGLFSNEGSEELTILKREIAISIERHGSKVIAIVGHHDCAGNPGDREHHHKNIREAVERLTSWNLNVEIIGLYVNENWQIEEVT